MYIAESNLNMLSPTGRSRMWDAGADGYARGEGVGAVVLKTLSAALRDGDHIECLIRETGINQVCLHGILLIFIHVQTLSPDLGWSNSWNHYAECYCSG